MRYELKGKCSVVQHCYDRYPKAEQVGLSMLKRCPSPEACEGHFIVFDVCETVEVKNIHNRDDIIAASLKAYEGQELEPCWEEGPEITPIAAL